MDMPGMWCSSRSGHQCRQKHSARRFKIHRRGDHGLSLVYFSRLREITQESPAFRHGEWSNEAHKFLVNCFTRPDLRFVAERIEEHSRGKTSADQLYTLREGLSVTSIREKHGFMKVIRPFFIIKHGNSLIGEGGLI
ncbi:hypothetical protein SAMN05444955_111127 [Lihuaxuella thermophila]|uniref:Uncharacterized protein n=1 Tax=Lihuaxuella thermophila TaxID=1173111 RepID=A0A1H8GM67_9BACL|nr:hypothetical protein SAMN05444955_111127 [Lihuaxuella thermophila]